MKYCDEVVNYQNNEYKVLEIIKELDLSIPSYYRSIKNNKSPQEAFDNCLLLKEKQNKKKGINVIKVAKDNNISHRTVYEGIYNNKNIDMIILETKEKQEIRKENLNYLYSIGLPPEYNSLTSFCKREGLNFSRVHNGIQKGYNLHDAILYSLIPCNRKSKYIYLNIPLIYISQKYNLDYNQLLYWIKTCSYKDAIHNEIFSSMFHKNMGSRLNYLRRIYQNKFICGEDVKNDITEEEYEIFIQYQTKINYIDRKISYYEFLETIDIAYFFPLNLDERIKRVLLSSKYLPFNLSELYYILDFSNGLMKDFIYNNDNNIWIYNNRNKEEILSRIKKPS